MTEEERKEQERKLKEEADNLSELDIAELANKELRKKEEENARLRKELAQAKLYSLAEDDEVEDISKEDALKTIGDGRSTNYDYAQAVVSLVDIERAEGNPNPLGKNGEQVYNFFKDVIEECAGDKSRFTSIYQARLGPDDPQVAMAYRNRQ